MNRLIIQQERKKFKKSFFSFKERKTRGYEYYFKNVDFPALKKRLKIPRKEIRAAFKSTT